MSAIEALACRRCGWLAADAPRGDLVLSSRVRLARNLAGRVFPQRAAPEERARLLEDVFDRTRALNVSEDVLHLSLDKLSPLEREFLVERQIASRELVETPAHRGVVVGLDGTVSFMVNEEDHLRLQALQPGFDLDAAYRVADGLDRELDGRLEFAYSERFGFLTACPTNAGTGMRASVLMHLPGMALTKELKKFLATLRSRQMTLRGFRGEGSAAIGNYFQISNAATLGVREQAILAKLHGAVLEVVAWERRAREELLSRARSLLEDKIWRSYGILRHARVLTSQEALDHSAMLRLGAGLGIVPIPLHVLNEILVETQPAHVSVLGQQDGAAERDAWRAETVRRKLQLGDSR